MSLTSAYHGNSYDPYAAYFGRPQAQLVKSSDVRSGPLNTSPSQGTIYKDPNSTGLYFIANDGQIFYNANPSADMRIAAKDLPRPQQQQSSYSMYQSYAKPQLSSNEKINIAASTLSNISSQMNINNDFTNGVQNYVNGSNSGGIIGGAASLGASLSEKGSSTAKGWGYLGDFYAGNSKGDISKGLTNVGVKYGANYIINNTASGSTANTLATVAKDFYAGGGGVEGIINAGTKQIAGEVANTVTSTASSTASSGGWVDSIKSFFGGGSSATASAGGTATATAGLTTLGAFGAVVAGALSGTTKGMMSALAVYGAAALIPGVNVIMAIAGAAQMIFGDNFFSSAIGKTVGFVADIGVKAWDLTKDVADALVVKPIKAVVDVGKKLLKGAGNVLKKLKFW